MATVREPEPPIGILSSVEAARSNGNGSNGAVAIRGFPPIPVKLIPYATAKRCLDVIVSLFGMVFFCWLYGLVALAVRLTSRGPVFFNQTRVGAGGDEFTCYKFRSMREGAEEEQEQLQHLNEAEGPVFKIKKDPRFTPIGRFLRKFSLDEMPQLYNVLRGEMSIVGPRPPIRCEVEHYSERDFGRLAVKPGLTCLWQINGRSDIPFGDWIELDLKYIRTMSFWGDVVIVLKTIPAVLTGRGAH